MFPIAFDFSPDEYNSVVEIIPYLTKIGFDIREFGENSIIIEGTPPELNIGREKEVINQILDNYIENKQLNSSFINYMAATYACNAAVKAGDKLDDDECISLVDKLFSTKHPYYCPHGRPIIINLSMNDLDKRFERI
jgi:DNA mismatch repair protein MutL